MLIAQVFARGGRPIVHITWGGKQLTKYAHTLQFFQFQFNKLKESYQAAKIELLACRP